MDICMALWCICGIGEWAKNCGIFITGMVLNQGAWKSGSMATLFMERHIAFGQFVHLFLHPFVIPFL